MTVDPVATVVWIVLFVLVAVSVTGLARRLNWSAPVMLVAVGGIASFVPFVPAVEVQPELVLYGVLPPLLFAAAVRTSVLDVRARRDSILALSIGLVIASVVVVGFTTSLLLPSIGLAAAFAFAAVVAPTDAVAVTAVAGRVGLPRRIVTILEGESLLNDATALVALSAAVTAITMTVSPWFIAGKFAIAVLGGVAAGAATAAVMSFLRARLRSPVIDTSLALITPYLAFISAEAVLGSGVLAVVIAGLYLGYRSPIVQSAEARIAESVNWRTIQFLLENAVFLFIGLNLAGVLQGAIRTGPGLWPTIVIGATILVALVVTRFVFVFAVAGYYRIGPRRLRDQRVQWRNAVAVAAANVRGVVTLAAVFLLPPQTPQREFLQFLAFVVVVVTLISGLFLPSIVKHLRLPTPNRTQERVEWLNLLAEAQVAGLNQLDREITDTDDERVIMQLRARADLVAESLAQPLALDTESMSNSYARLRRAMIRAEREAVIAARSEGRYPDSAVRSALQSIDAEELSLRTGPKQDRPSTPKKPRGKET